jgi:NTE family protein
VTELANQQAAERAAGRPSIGLALSGGGFRATMFGLGALRALHDRGVLGDVTVVSGISGGSLLAAMWAYGPRDFADFDATVHSLVGSGLQWELVRRALSPPAAVRAAVGLARAAIGAPFGGQPTALRTEALVDALADRPFGTRQMTEVTHPDLRTVLSATDLASGKAVRFGSAYSSLWTLGDIAEPVPVADAVAASASFPALLPPLTRRYTFVDRAGVPQRTTLRMIDGGVYDNLGLTPLLPGRSAQHTRHVYPVDYVVAIDAGQARPVRTPPRFLLGRLMRSFDIAYGKAQDGTRARLNQAAAAGHVRGFIHAYLPTRDQSLPLPLADLVPRDAVGGLPTNFAATSPEDWFRVTTRGEQLTRLLIETYCPELGTH